MHPINAVPGVIWHYLYTVILKYVINSITDKDVLFVFPRFWKVKSIFFKNLIIFDIQLGTYLKLQTPIH
jgi:hypothetical protein